MLPGLLITGAGVGLTLPALGSAAAASLPPQRFATGSAVFTMFRQLGFVLGVAVLIAVLGSPVGEASSSFDGGWLLMVGASVAATAAAFAIGPRDAVSPASSPGPVAAATRSS